MKLYQKVSLVIANEGMSGFFQRLAGKLLSNDGKIALRQESSRRTRVSEYSRSIEDFNRKAESMGYEDIRNYWWYHTIELGSGLITPGYYDYRDSISSFKFPDMKGMSVLEVGSATGCFAFEFEKMGANVTSVEIPSWADFDLFPGETLEQCFNKFENIVASTEQLLPASVRHDHLYRSGTPEEAHHYILDGPFKFCHKMLKSKVRRCYSTIYDLSIEKLGSDRFDVVFLGDVLVHTLYPLKALAAAAAVCRRTLIIAQELPVSKDDQPAMVYIGGDEIGHDAGGWWLPNRACIEQMLKKLGFKDVRIVGTHSGYVRPTGQNYERAIFHATK